MIPPEEQDLPDGDHHAHPSSHDCIASVVKTIDFSRSLPPPAQGLGQAIAHAAGLLASERELGTQARASKPRGTEEDRQTAAHWLQPHFRALVDPDRIILTNGTQSAVLILLHHLVRPGQVLAAEGLTYGALGELTEVAGVPVVPLQLDEEGIRPDHFDEVCRTSPVGAVYTNPTFHNPTTAIMSEERRTAIAEIASRYGVPIIEDDPIGRLYEGLPRPISALAPHITWHISGLTKCIAQGMRLGYLVAPNRTAAERLVGEAARRTNWVAAPLMAIFLRHMIETGSAASVAAEIAAENIAREKAAREILTNCALCSKPGSPHVWVRLGTPAQTADLVEKLKQGGVIVRPAGMFAVGCFQPEAAIRLSLSGPALRDDVMTGLRLTAVAIRDRPEP